MFHSPWPNCRCCRQCERLPHCVALLSNLDDHLAVRVLDAMTTELTRRQADLDRAGFESADQAWAAAWHSAELGFDF